VVTAVAQSGEDLQLAAPLSILPGESIKALGSAADGTILLSGYLPFSSGAPTVTKLEAEAQKIDPKVPLDAELESAYASVETFAKAVEGLPTVNAETTMSALPKLSGYDTGLGPVVDFGASNPTKTFSRVVNTKVYVLEAKDGEVVLAQKQPLDTAPAFEALAKAGK
jgi:ABC-type branched-subunit amino acid transport system substrate-binding protein